MKTKHWIISLLLIPWTVGAQGIETYGEALKLALDNNPALARTYFDFAASQERIDVVEGELRPQSICSLSRAEKIARHPQRTLDGTTAVMCDLLLLSYCSMALRLVTE